MPRGHGTQFRRLLSRAVAAYLKGPNLATAAAAIGISRGTMSRWTRDPFFIAMLETAQATELQRELDRLRIVPTQFPRIHRTA